MCSCSRKSWILFTVSTCMTSVQSFQNPICTAVFLLFTAICFFARVHDRYDTINSHLTQIFMCAAVNVKTMLLGFFYLHVTNYQLYSSPSDYKFCYMFLCTCVYKISWYTTLIPKFCQATKAKMFMHIGFVNSYTTVTTNYFQLAGWSKKMTMHLGFVNLCTPYSSVLSKFWEHRGKADFFILRT